MFNSDFGPGFSAAQGTYIWMIISFVLALAGCFVVYFIFVAKKDNPKEKFLAWLKGFLSFEKMLIEPIMKIAYIFTAIYITLSSFAVISTSFVGFLIYLLAGNLIARLGFEAAMMMIMIWKNTTDINKKLK